MDLICIVKGQFIRKAAVHIYQLFLKAQTPLVKPTANPHKSTTNPQHLDMSKCCGFVVDSTTNVQQIEKLYNKSTANPQQIEQVEFEL
jgi:hypothetical protein